MGIALTYVVGSKHEEFIFLKTKSVNEYKKKLCEFIKTKNCNRLFGGGVGNIRVCLSLFETVSGHSICFSSVINTLSTR